MQEFDKLIPDPLVRAEFNVGPLTVYRWDHSPQKAALGWPPRIKIGARNFRSRAALEAFKANLVALALKARAEGKPAQDDVTRPLTRPRGRPRKPVATSPEAA